MEFLEDDQVRRKYDSSRALPKSTARSFGDYQDGFAGGSLRPEPHNQSASLALVIRGESAEILRRQKRLLRMTKFAGKVDWRAE